MDWLIVFKGLTEMVLTFFIGLVAVRLTFALSIAIYEYYIDSWNDYAPAPKGLYSPPSIFKK